MPLLSEVETHMSSVLASERENCARRMQREQVRAELAAEAATEQIRLATAAKAVLEENAKAYAASLVADAQARLQKEADRQAAELAGVRARVEEAARLAAHRVQAAAAGLEVAQAEAAERVGRAEQANQDAIKRAQDIAKESEDLALAREAEAARREEEARSRADQHAKGKMDREVHRAQDAEQRVAALQGDAQKRAETMKRSAADLIDKYVNQLREWMLRAEREMDATKERIEMERRRAHQQAASVKSLASSFLDRAEHCVHDAEKTHVDAVDTALKVQQDHEHWRAGEMTWIADQADGLSGLEDMARRLRDDAAKLLELDHDGQA